MKLYDSRNSVQQIARTGQQHRETVQQEIGNSTTAVILSNRLFELYRQHRETVQQKLKTLQQPQFCATDCSNCTTAVAKLDDRNLKLYNSRNSVQCAYSKRHSSEGRILEIGTIDQNGLLSVQQIART